MLPSSHHKPEYELRPLPPLLLLVCRDDQEAELQPWMLAVPPPGKGFCQTLLLLLCGYQLPLGHLYPHDVTEKSGV